MASADVRDVAASRNPLLKVSSESKPNSVAGAICNVVRENARNNPPSVMATGPAAINQAMKAIAIARKYLLDEETPIDLLVFPKFEQARPPPRKENSRVCTPPLLVPVAPSSPDLAGHTRGIQHDLRAQALQPDRARAVRG